MSPTRRLGRLLQADQPVFVRREAASSLGRDIPFWEVDQAVGMLLSALSDPSPRVREYVGVGLAELGPRAERAVPKLITVLNDQDRGVRSTAARTLSFLIGPASANRTEALTALSLTLQDKDPDVRLAATETMVKLGEPQKAAATLFAACRGKDSYFRGRARLIMRAANGARPFVSMLAERMRDQDGPRRDEALQTLLQFASPQTVRSALNSALADDNSAIHDWAAARLEGITPGR